MKNFKGVLEGPYKISVPYDVSTEDLVEDGLYTIEVNDGRWLPENYGADPQRGEVQEEIFLLNFQKEISTYDVLMYLKKKHLRPGNIQEMLILGIDHPDFDFSNPVIALGSPWESPHLFYPSTTCRRSLRLVYGGSGSHQHPSPSSVFRPETRFLVGLK